MEKTVALFKALNLNELRTTMTSFSQDGWFMNRGLKARPVDCEAAVLLTTPYWSQQLQCYQHHHIDHNSYRLPQSSVRSRSKDQTSLLLRSAELWTFRRPTDRSFVLPCDSVHTCRCATFCPCDQTVPVTGHWHTDWQQISKLERRKYHSCHPEPATSKSRNQDLSIQEASNVIFRQAWRHNPAAAVDIARFSFSLQRARMAQSA